jgi:hypothetical protein
MPTSETAFMHDVQGRLANRVQLTSDGLGLLCGKLQPYDTDVYKKADERLLKEAGESRAPGMTSAPPPEKNKK